MLMRAPEPTVDDTEQVLDTDRVIEVLLAPRRPQTNAEIAAALGFAPDSALRELLDRRKVKLTSDEAGNDLWEFDLSRCEIFGPSDREYIANMIDHYLAGTVPDDYEDAERFLIDCECGFWMEETETGHDARVRIEYLTREAFEANPQLAIDVVWDDLARWMYCHVLGVHYLEVVGDWRPDKLEYLRAVIADEVSRGHVIVYFNWPDYIEKPAPGPTMNEFI
ncbi:MAG: hypothetical protein HYV60_19475, partial [Planctomycetia bacterium]|nr:hypothetical protein [Planctomycetia bacterium]